MARRMVEQMELFEPVERGFDEGGLMDEGGTVDPVSGNDVPPGSTQEEVRDDIPAQLSEGEFVFPADVVRYIGLENLMRMRQEAKQGLAQMEAMGQMGNSEEATVKDNLPFDMYDLDVEDDAVEMAQGGMPTQQQQSKDPRIPSGYVTYKGPVKDIIHQIEGGIKSGLSYVGCEELRNLHNTEIELLMITNQGFRESGSHGISEI